MFINPEANVVTITRTTTVSVTGWFDAESTQPFLPGVYELNPVFVGDDSVRRFSYYDGRGWKISAAAVERAEDMKYTDLYERNVQTFRGLTQRV